MAVPTLMIFQLSFATGLAPERSKIKSPSNVIPPDPEMPLLTPFPLMKNVMVALSEKFNVPVELTVILPVLVIVEPPAKTSVPVLMVVLPV